MASHPYISGAGNLTQIVGLLRKNFPAVITSETVKKFGLASKNESYVINALQFIGVINEEGKRTSRASDVFTIHNEEDFQKAFDGLIRNAYKDLFELRGDDAWTLSRADLIGYFRTNDKTSDIIGTRQAAVFKAFAALAGHNDENTTAKSMGVPRPRGKVTLAASTAKTKRETSAVEVKSEEIRKVGSAATRDMALTVRIEINLPADGTRETYDNIFQSIRTNLLNE
jgi:hypothetical protein